LFISSIIGIVAGLLPAYTAANLNPVEAINSK
jgi:ABC-type antimicrobial peptide transport system permease subunit